MQLSGEQLENLENALIDAFPDKVSLERMLFYNLDKNLNEVAGEGNLRYIAFKLIQTADAQGWVDQLIDAACRENPGNQLLQAIATELRANNLTKTPYNSSKEDALAEYRLTVKEFAEDVEISYGESEILNDLQKKLKLTEEEVRTIRDEVLEPFGKYRENLDKYRQVFTKWIGEQGYPLKEKAKADLKKLQEHYQLKDEDIALLFKEAEQQEAEKLQRQEAAEILRQEQEKAEYKTKLQRYKDVALVEQPVIAPKESGYRRQRETKRLKPQQPTPSDDLSSARNVDYTKLRDFLKAGCWREADEETLAVMLAVSGREEEGWLDSESIENFPCTDLRTIDQLWIKYSDGRFGFSVQKRIWDSVGKDYGKFGDCVGWSKDREWIRCDDVTFDTTAPPGHLPICVCAEISMQMRMRIAIRWNYQRISSLASRLINCNI